MRVYLHEKKDQALTLSRILGLRRRTEYFVEHKDGSKAVWCNGHLLELADAAFYNAGYKRWTLADLPISPARYEFVVKRGCEQRLEAIRKILNSASEVVIATDYDREGELIGRTVLNYCGFKGQVKRLKVLSLDDESLKEGLRNLEDLSTTETLYQVAKARVYCDWDQGINLTRLYTCLGRKAGMNEYLSVGRVITPTAALVVDRDRAIASYQPYDFYNLRLTVDYKGQPFTVKWVPDETLKNAENKVTERYCAERVVALVKKYPLYVREYRSRIVKELPPLPFSQTSLQIYCGTNYGLKPSEVLSISQALYDSRHRMITYPRTACRYLPLNQHLNAAKTLDALARGDPSFAPLILQCDPRLKSRAFSDEQCGTHAHHAMIPNCGTQDLSRLSRSEYAVYDAIRRFYVAQFYLPAEYREVKAVLRCGDVEFTATARTLIDQGYRVVFETVRDLKHKVIAYNRDPDAVEERDSEDEEINDKIPKLKEGDTVRLLNAEIVMKKTKAPKHFTPHALIAAMANISRSVTDKQLKKILVNSNGIGTEDTRAYIVDNLKKCGYVAQEGKILVSTAKARALVDAVPWELCSPELTAQREQSFESIKSGLLSEEAVVRESRRFTASIVAALSAPGEQNGVIAAFKAALPDIQKSHQERVCAKCGSVLLRLRGKYGYFWRCSDLRCGATFSDADKKKQS